MRRLLHSLTLCLATVSCRTVDDQSDVRARPPDRPIIGAPTPLAAPLADAPRLRASMKERRDHAWQVVAAALRDVELSQGVGADLALKGKVPAFGTWYDGREVEGLFKYVYKASPEAATKRWCRRSPLTDADHAAGLAKLLARPVPGIDAAAYRRTVASAERIQGVIGLVGDERTAFSPELTRHLTDEFRQLVPCLAKLEKAPDPAARPGLSNHAPCFSQEFPHTSAAIKTAWSRQVAGSAEHGVRVFDTSATALEAIFAPRPEAPQQEGAWTKARDATLSELASSRIHTALMHGNYTEWANAPDTFRLQALHIATKSVREWLWITLWWSPTPDEDFGADRPAEVRALGGAWSNYKMCVVVDYEDGDDAPWQHYETDHPTLAKALRSVGTATGKQTWCSNPYLEHGAGNARTNCVGCHQYAGTSLTTADVLARPDVGRPRETFVHPTDYVWGAARPDDVLVSRITGKIAEVDNDVGGEPCP